MSSNSRQLTGRTGSVAKAATGIKPVSEKTSQLGSNKRQIAIFPVAYAKDTGQDIT